MTPEQLIDRLADAATPVRRLRPPAFRWLVWLLVAAGVAALLLLTHGVRADLSDRAADPGFLLGTGAALIAAAVAAGAALLGSLPDRSRAWLLLPLPFVAIWVAGVTGGCLANWITTDFSIVTLDAILECLSILAFVSVPLTALLFWMLRPVRRVAPAGAVAVAALAAAMLAAAMLNLTHRFDASALVLIWNLGAAALVFLLDLLAAWLFRPTRPRSADYART